jgi:hypothetical protein
MMNEDIKRRLREGIFVAKILSLDIDVEEYERLCDDLREIARSWEGKVVVDKELAWLIYDIPKIMLNCARDAEQVRPSVSEVILDMALEIDTLVLSCFHDEMFK